MHTNKQRDSVCKPHVLKRPAHSQRLQSMPEQIRILLVLMMKNFCPQRPQHPELLKLYESKSMSAIPVWRKVKIDHECSTWPTESTNKTHWTHWTRSKDTKVDTRMTKITKVWKKDEVSAVSQLSPHHPRRGHTHGVRASPDRHSLHLTWLDHDILCECVSLAGRWPGQQRRERWQCKPRSPGPQWNTASKVFFKLRHCSTHAQHSVQVFTIFVNSHGHC